MNIQTPSVFASTTATSGVQADAVIEAAWKRRQEAYIAYNAMPDDETAIAGTYTPAERKLWDTIDAAEAVIHEAVATTPRGVMLQLWCAMYHSVTGREDDAALTRGDFAAIDRLDNDLDWNVRLILAALRSLQKLEG